MKKLTTLNLSLIACALFLPAVVSAQNKSTPAGDKVIILATTKAGLRKNTAAVSKILPASEEAEAADQKAPDQLAGRARLEGNYLIIDFTAGLSKENLKLTIPSNLPLDDIGGQCTEVQSGTYAVSRNRSEIGTVKLLVTTQNPAGRHRPWHGWFHTRCVDCCGGWGRRN